MTRSRLDGRDEQGSVLLLALLVTLLILGIGLTAMWISTSGTKISSNLTRRQEALYAAETGLGRARALLRQYPGLWPTFLAGCSATMDDPTNKGMVLCEPGGTPVALQLTPVVAAGSITDTQNPGMTNVRYTIYVRNDPFEYQWCNGITEPGETADTGDCNGDSSADATDANLRQFGDVDRRITVRVEGHGKDGLSQVAIEALISAGVTAAAAPGYAQKGGSSGGGASATPSASVPAP